MIAEIKIKPNYYRGIEDMPILNFDKLCKTKGVDWQTQWFLKDVYDDLQEGFDPEVQWDKIYDEYLERYGLSEDYLEWCKLIKKAANARYKAYINVDDRHLKTHAEIFQKQADELRRDMDMQGGGGDLDMACAFLSKYMSMIIDPRKITVVQFNAYLETAKKAQKNG